MKCLAAAWLSAFMTACGGEPRVVDTAVVDTTPPRAPSSDHRPEREAPTEARRSTVDESRERAPKDQLDLPECETYFARMEACLAGMPGADRKMIEQMVAQMRETFRSMAGQSGMNGIREACTLGLETWNQVAGCP